MDSELDNARGNFEHNNATARYRAELEAIDAECNQLEARDRRFGKLRAGLFFLALGLWVVGYGFDGMPQVGGFGWAVFVLFYVAVIANEPTRDRLDERRKNRSVVLRLIARLERNWDQLFSKRIANLLAEVELPSHRRDVAGDLDLLGGASLFQFVSMAATTPGIRTLAQWLSGPAITALAQQRADAAVQLGALHDERIRFYTLARRIGESSGDPDRFVAWATGEPWLAKRRWLVTWSTISAIASVVCLGALILVALRVLPPDFFFASLYGLGGLTAANMLITTVVLGPAHEIFSIAMSNRRAVADYQEFFAAANWLPAVDESAGDGFLSKIRRAMIDDHRSAAAGMRRLSRIARAGGLRQSAGTFMFYLPLQALGLWDVWVLRKLEAWQSEYADQVPDWFESLGEFEALMSIAALWDEYPDWTRPDWTAAQDNAKLTATQLGHPLLADNARVCNDVELGPPGTLLLVTGSNMSGKSTLLRSIGLNTQLAAVGAPVCATSMRLPPAELATSIRVSDDVSQGVSFYMAELKRLKTVVDHAREMASINDRVCLFLLDEILQGTNSQERQIAVLQVLRHLMDSGAIGAISTHDLALADEEELKSVALTVHFRETIHPDAQGNDQMTFDYKMRQGVSPTTNALRLLEMVGLGKK